MPVSNIFLVVVFLVSLLYIVMKYKPKMKNVSAGKLSVVYLPSILLAIGAMFLIYFGNNWLSGMIDNFYALVFTQFFFVLITLSICTFIIDALFKKAVSKSSKRTA